MRLLYRFADHRVADVDMTILDLADDRIVHSVSCAQVEFLDSLVKHIDCTCLGAGELRRLGDDRVQDGFEVHGRIHRLADLAKRPQLVDRLTELARTCLNLIEQQHILDSDDGLVGERRG